MADKTWLKLEAQMKNRVGARVDVTVDSGGETNCMVFLVVGAFNSLQEILEHYTGTTRANLLHILELEPTNRESVMEDLTDDR